VSIGVTPTAQYGRWDEVRLTETQTVHICKRGAIIRFALQLGSRVTPTLSKIKYQLEAKYNMGGTLTTQKGILDASYTHTVYHKHLHV
jgi:hypothetical protein